MGSCTPTYLAFAFSHLADAVPCPLYLRFTSCSTRPWHGTPHRSITATGVVAVPLMFVWLLSPGLWHWMVGAGANVHERAVRGVPIGAVLTASVLTFVLVRVAARYGRGPTAGSRANRWGAPGSVRWQHSSPAIRIR